MGAGSRIRRLTERQAEDLARLEEREARAFLGVYEDARRELAEDIGNMEESGQDRVTPYTAQRMRAMLAQVESGIRRLQERLGVALDEAIRQAHEAALGDLLETVALGEAEFRDAGARIEHQALRRLTEDRGLLLHRYSVQRYGAELVDRMQREISVGLARGLSIPELRDRIAGPLKSVLSGAEARAELIVRMELNSAFNRANLTGLQEAAKELDANHEPEDRLRKRADEYLDLRNHAISRVLDGMVVDIDQPFRVKRADVERANHRLNAERAARKLPPKRTTGIVWPLEGSEYVGMNYPAHYWERGRITPWRASWEEDDWPSTPGGSSGSARTAPSMKPSAYNRTTNLWIPQDASDLRPTSDRFWEEPTGDAFARAGFRTHFTRRDPTSRRKQPDLGVEDILVEVGVPNSRDEDSLIRLIRRKTLQSPHVALNLDARKIWSADIVRDVVSRRRNGQDLRRLQQLWVVAGETLQRIV